MGSKLRRLLATLPVISRMFILSNQGLADSWAPIRKMSTVWNRQTAMLLLNGRVPAVGGLNQSPVYNPFNPHIDSAESYDSSTAARPATVSLRVLRLYHEATLSTNGKALAAAGSPTVSEPLNPLGLLGEPVPLHRHLAGHRECDVSAGDAYRASPLLAPSTCGTRNSSTSGTP